MSDLVLKTIGWAMILLPVISYFVWTYRELGKKAFIGMIKGMSVGILLALSFYIGLSIIK